MNHVLCESGCTAALASYYRYLFYAINCIPILSGAVDSRKTNIFTVIPGTYGLILIFIGEVGLRETNIIALIPGMHGIIST